MATTTDAELPILPLWLEKEDGVINLRNQIRELRRALRPFAMLLDEWKADGDTPPLRPGQRSIEMNLSVVDLVRAKRAYR